MPVFVITWLCCVCYDIVLRGEAGRHRRRLKMYVLMGQTILLARRLWCSQEWRQNEKHLFAKSCCRWRSQPVWAAHDFWEEPFGKVIGRSCLAARMLETVLGWSESGMQQRWLVEQITIWWAGHCSSCCTDKQEQVPVGEAELSVTWSDRHNRPSPLLLCAPWRRL